MPTCGDCQKAAFQKTPTGRIKRGLCGHCSADKELREQYSHKTAPPCIVVSPPPPPHVTAIWPNYDATMCPLYDPVVPP